MEDGDLLGVADALGVPLGARITNCLGAMFDRLFAEMVLIHQQNHIEIKIHNLCSSSDSQT